MTDDRRATVVVAPDSFKGSIGASDAATAIAEGWYSIRPDDRIHLLPQADGGEGTVDAIAGAVPSAVVHDTDRVTGPDGRGVPGRWLELPDSTAVIDLAATSGLPLMNDPDPLGAHTLGLGEVVSVALDSGMTRVVIGLGGSASTDGGAGALIALGLVLRDSRGSALRLGGASLADLTTIDRDRLRRVPSGGVVLLTDVDAPLLGRRGAAMVFGPQKGATLEQSEQLDAALARFARVLGGDPLAPGSGAAGGTAFGFASAWGGLIRPGAAYIAQLTGLATAMADADVVISGEGRFDETSLTGKVVGRAIDDADRLDVETVIVIAGVVSTTAHRADSTAVTTYALEVIAGSAALAMREPVAALNAAGRRAARDWTGKDPSR